MPGYLSQTLTIIGTGASTTGDLTGPIIDLASAAAGGGYYAEGVLLVAVAGTTNATSLLKSQTGTASDAMSDTTGDQIRTLLTTYLDHHRPSKRYFRGVLTAGGATGWRSLTTIPYGLREKPPTYDASATGIRVSSPGSGTATG